MYDVLQRGRHLIILTGPHQHPNEEAAYLIAQGVDPQTEALVGECLTLPDERIIHGTLGGIAALHFHWLSVLAVVHPVGINPKGIRQAVDASAQEGRS